MELFLSPWFPRGVLNTIILLISHMQPHALSWSLKSFKRWTANSDLIRWVWKAHIEKNYTQLKEKQSECGDSEESKTTGGLELQPLAPIGLVWEWPVWQMCHTWSARCQGDAELWPPLPLPVMKTCQCSARCILWLLPTPYSTGGRRFVLIQHDVTMLVLLYSSVSSVYLELKGYRGK